MRSRRFESMDPGSAGLPVLDRDVGGRRCPHRLEMDLEHPVAVASFDRALLRLPGKLDRALELAEVDLAAMKVRVSWFLGCISASADFERAPEPGHSHAIDRLLRHLQPPACYPHYNH